MNYDYGIVLISNMAYHAVAIIIVINATPVLVHIIQFIPYCLHLTSSPSLLFSHFETPSLTSILPVLSYCNWFSSNTPSGAKQYR
mmetsp:Transcript_11924/g.17378  ORF Transcript_11924/g.17378 Transcript_11924/m.17378 type:complete len:85 (+) Transcript_11924:138-392(+)